MGRYDISNFSVIHKFRLYKIRFGLIAEFGVLLAVFCAFASYKGAIAQESPQKGEETIDEKTYYLSMRYPLNIKHVYKLTENTKVTRTFSDDSKKEYTREVTYYFTQKIVTLPKEKYQQMDVFIDSMHYKMYEGSKIVEANTQDDNFVEKYTPDLSYSTIPNGRQFTITFSPYGDIAKIEGEKLESSRKYIIDQAKGMKDSIMKLIWMNQLSNENLIHITDLKKFLLPPADIGLDSVWKSPFYFMVDRKLLRDTVNVSVVEYDMGRFTIGTKFENPDYNMDYGVFHGIKTVAAVDSVRGGGQYAFQIDERGVLVKSEGIYKVKFFARANKEEFVDEIELRSFCDLIGRFKW